MCNCDNVEMGSYAAEVVSLIPEHMRSYRESRLRDGLAPIISFDRCCLPQIQHLWSLGVVTLGCCCGHNKVKGFVNVGMDGFQKAIDAGYKPYVFIDDQKRRDTIEFENAEKVLELINKG